MFVNSLSAKFNFPEWMSLCVLRLYARVNILSHWLQAKVFFPECESLCLLRLSTREKAL